MPRTRKQAARKVSAVPAKNTDMLASFNKTYKHAVKTFESDMKISMDLLQSLFKSSRKLIAPEVGNRLYEDVVRECTSAETNREASITSTCETEFEATTPHSSTLLANSDGHGDDLTGSQQVGSVADSTSKHVSFMELPPPMSSSNFKTPAVNLINPSSSVVTPKVRPNDCLPFVRVPTQGEVAISMKGSPLLVTPFTQNRVVTQVPLADGRVFSILPAAKFTPYEVPVIDDVTRGQLLKISEHINSFVAMTDKVKRCGKT